MPELKQYEELSVLEQGDDGAIVSIRGQNGPSVLLGSEYLKHLDQVLSAALMDIRALPMDAGKSRIERLCNEVKFLLTSYEVTLNKYHGGGAPNGARTLSDAIAELDELRRQLDKLR